MSEFEGKWICVEDKLPSDLDELCPQDFVLVYAEEGWDGVSYPSMHGIAKFINNKWDIIGDAGGHSCVGAFEFKSEYVTHWKILDYPT